MSAVSRGTGGDSMGISGRRESIRAGRIVRLVAPAVPESGAMAGGEPAVLFGVDGVVTGLVLRTWPTTRRRSAADVGQE